MPYKRKTRDEWVLLGNWGFGWEEVLCEDTFKEIKQKLYEYISNDKTASYRIVKRRVRLDKS